MPRQYLHERASFWMLAARSIMLRRLHSVIAMSGVAEQLQALIDLAEPASRAAWGPDEDEWTARIAAEHERIVVVLRWLIDEGDKDTLTHGLRLVDLLRPYWVAGGRAAEMLPLVERLLARADVSILRASVARAEDAAGALAFHLGDYPLAAQHADRALALWQAVGDPGHTAQALSHRAIVALEGERNPQEARHLLLRSLALRRQVGSPRPVATALSLLGDVELVLGDASGAGSYYEEAVAIAAQSGTPQMHAHFVVQLQKARAVGHSSPSRSLVQPRQRSAHRPAYSRHP